MGSERRQITIAVFLAYFMGFIAGCLILGMLGTGGLSQGEQLLERLVPDKGSAQGKYISNRVQKLLPVTGNADKTNEVVKITNDVQVGSEAQVLIRTQPGQVCTIRYINPGGIDETLPSPLFQIAGDDGLCGWRWQIQQKTPTGTGTLYLAANGETIQAFFRVNP